MSDISNKTADDAVARLNQARIGSLANEPSLKYLLTLSREIDQWHAKIHEAIYAHPQYNMSEKDECPCENSDWDGVCTGCVYSDKLECPW